VGIRRRLKPELRVHPNMSDVDDAGDRRLRVDLDVDPSDEPGCPVVAETESASDVAVNAVGDECVVDVTPSDGTGVVSGTGAVTDDCLCAVFRRVGCVPRFRRVEDGTILVTTYVDTGGPSASWWPRSERSPRASGSPGSRSSRGRRRPNR